MREAAKTGIRVPVIPILIARRDLLDCKCEISEVLCPGATAVSGVGAVTDSLVQVGSERHRLFG